MRLAAIAQLARWLTTPDVNNEIFAMAYASDGVFFVLAAFRKN